MGQLYDPVQDEAVYQSVRATLETGRTKVARAVNDVMVLTYWEIGRQISQAQGERAEYGKHLIGYLSDRLTAEFGSVFSTRNLRYTKQFYLAFPIVNTLCSQLSWSHYRLIMRIEDQKRRELYTHAAAEETWTVPQLDRQIHSSYYEQLLATQEDRRDIVRKEVKRSNRARK